VIQGEAGANPARAGKKGVILPERERKELNNGNDHK